MRVYVATSFATRERVHAFMARLRARVPGAVLAYDWTKHTADSDPVLVAGDEFSACIDADFFVALWPGGLGTVSEVAIRVAGEPLFFGEPYMRAPLVVGCNRDRDGWYPAPVLELCDHVARESDAIDIIAAGCGL
jgi:hypothetical protein